MEACQGAHRFARRPGGCRFDRQARWGRAVISARRRIRVRSSLNVGWLDSPREGATKISEWLKTAQLSAKPLLAVQEMQIERLVICGNMATAWSTRGHAPGCGVIGAVYDLEHGQALALGVESQTRTMVTAKSGEFL
jgi:hypothetical protein